MALVLSGCNSGTVDFNAIKVFDSQFNIALETGEENRIKELKVLFNNKAEFNEMAPNFRYLIEFNTSAGTERWRYSSNGYTQKYSQEDQTIYALLNKDKFNELAHIN